MALTQIDTYAVAHDKGNGGGGGTTIIKQYGGNGSSYGSLNVTNLNASNIVADNIESKNLSVRDGSILYLISKEGTINKLNGQSLEYDTGYIGTLATDEISTKKLTADEIEAVKGWIETLNSKNITTEYLTVTKQAHFFELIIDKIRSVGGQLIITPANCIVDYVWGMDSNNVRHPAISAWENDNKKYEIFWRCTDSDGRNISNDFVVGDQVICQSFNNVHPGANYNVSNKYYWRLVTAVDNNRYWVNLSTGETSVADAGDSMGTNGPDVVQTAVITMGYTKTLNANNEYINNLIPWKVEAQTIEGIQPTVTWTSLPAGVDECIKGTMTSTSNVLGIQITPDTTDNTGITNKVEFGGIPVGATIGIYFKDGSFNIYRKTTSSNSIETIEIPDAETSIEAITIVLTNDSQWKLCNRMVISNEDKDETLSGYSSIPAPGDNLVQLGYRYNDDVSRQNAIIISAYRSIDQGGTYDGKTWQPIVSPSYAQYIGINDYNLYRHRQSFMDGNGAKFVGDITLCSINGENVGDKFDEQIDLLNKMNTKINLNTNIIELYLDNQNHIYYNPNTINIDILRTDETGTSILNAIPDGYKLLVRFRYDNNILTTTYNAGQSTQNISVVNSNIHDADYDTLDQHVVTGEVRLVMIQNGIADNRLPVVASDTFNYRRGLVAVKDGGKYEFRYQNSHTAPSKPTSGSDGLSGGWARSVESPDIANEIWTWMTYAYCNAGGEYGTWSDPIRITGENGEDGADGASVEYIYTRNNTGTVPTAPPQTQTDDWWGLDPNTGITWTDNPKGVSKDLQYEFISCRTKRAGGLWGLYSTPALWSKWGEKGMDGDGYEYIFKLQDSLTPPADPTPDDWETNPYYQTAEYHPLGWTDDPVSVTQNNKYLFVAVRTRKEGVWNRFSAPALWARYAEQGETGGRYEFRYKNSATQPDAPTEHGTTDGWSDTPTNPDVNNGIYTWMSQCYVTPATPEDHYGEWSTPVRITGGNGEDGADGTDIEFVYTRTNTTAQVPTPATNQIPDWHGSSGGYTWTDNPQGVASDLKYEWMSMRYLRQDVYTAYTTPVIWSAYGDKGMDGDGFEYVFKNTETAEAPTNPTPSDWETNSTYQQADYVPSGWTDDPESVSESVPYEWVMIRKRINGTWQRFSDPALWARWAVQGSSGGHYEFRFNKSINKPSAPATGSTGLTDGWSRNAANLTQADLAAGYLNWMCQCYVTGDGSYGVWGDVFRITGDKGKDGEDGQSIEFIYKGTAENTAPTKPGNSQVPDYVPSGWTDNPSGIASNMPYEWVCSREIENGTWSDWNGPVLWSAWGKNGTDGDGVEYIFRKTSNSTSPVNPTPTNYASNTDYQQDEYVPSNWSDDPPSLSGSEPYCWVCIRKGHAGSWGRFSNPALWSHYATAEGGQPGDNAEFDYLVPEEETLMAMILQKIENGGNCDLKCHLKYKLCHVNGSSSTYADWATAGFVIRIKCFNAAGTNLKTIYMTENGYESGTPVGEYNKTNLLAEINTSGAADKRDYMKCYTDYNSSCPVYLEITLMSGNTEIDKRVKYVDLENGAMWKLRDDAIVSAVANSTQAMNTALQSYSTTKQTAELINTTVNSQMSNYATTTQMNSAINQSAQSIISTVNSTHYTKDEVDALLNDENSFEQTLDLLNGGYSENNYYPVSVSMNIGSGDSTAVANGLIATFQVDRSLSESGFGTPNYGSRYNGTLRGFALCCNWNVIPSQWGEWGNGEIYVNQYTLRYTGNSYSDNDSENTGGTKVIGNLEQFNPTSIMVFYLRGGSKYHFRYNWSGIQASVHKTDYTAEAPGYSSQNKTYKVIYGADSSQITVPQKDKMTHSEIVQTAKQISLSVYGEQGDGITEDQLVRTGIDVKNGVINLDAANTNVIGTLNIYNDSAGFQVWNADKTRTSQIRNDSLPSLGDYTVGGWRQMGGGITGNKPQTSTGGSFEFSITTSIGTLSKDQKITIEGIGVNAWGTITDPSWSTHGSYYILCYGPDKTITKADITAELLSGSTVVKTVSESNLSGPDAITRSIGFWGIMSTKTIDYTLPSQQALSLRIKAKLYTRGDANKAGEYSAQSIFTTYIPVNSVNAMYINGMVMGSVNDNPGEKVWWGPFKYASRYGGDYVYEVRNRRHALRVSTFGVQRPIYNQFGETSTWIDNGKFSSMNANSEEGERIWCDVGSYTPVCNISYGSSIDLNTSNEQGIPTIMEYGIFVVNTNNVFTINLPKPEQIPGKVLKFKNIGGGTIKLTCTGKSEAFMNDINQSKSNEIGNLHCTFTVWSAGSYWIQDYWKEG